MAKNEGQPEIKRNPKKALGLAGAAVVGVLAGQPQEAEAKGGVNWWGVLNTVGNAVEQNQIYQRERKEAEVRLVQQLLSYNTLVAQIRDKYEGSRLSYEDQHNAGLIDDRWYNHYIKTVNDDENAELTNQVINPVISAYVQAGFTEQDACSGLIRNDVLTAGEITYFLTGGR